MSTATPRILPAHLQIFTPSGRPAGASSSFPSTIRLLGRVSSIHGDTASIECPTTTTGGTSNPMDTTATVTLHLNRESHLSVGTAVEVVGKVNQGDLSVKVLQVTEWGKASEVDWRGWAAVVDATHRWKEIFYEGEEDGGGIGY